MGLIPIDRTSIQYDKLDAVAIGTHDCLKYLKFCYGRETVEVSKENRHGRLTSEQGITIVRKLDHVRSRELDYFLEI